MHHQRALQQDHRRAGRRWASWSSCRWWTRPTSSTPGAGIDWDVIFLMFGMMMIVSILRQTGVFEYAAIWAVKRANGSPLRIMILLMLVMALASALLPNVVSVLLIAPVTLLVCDATGDQPRTDADSRGVRVQYRRRSDAGRRSTEHHHRRPQRPVVQRISGEHGPDRGDHHAGLRRGVALAVPRLLRGLSRKGRGRHGDWTTTT